MLDVQVIDAPAAAGVAPEPTRLGSAVRRAAAAGTIAKLVSKYHGESAPGGRAHRLVVAHPLPQKSDPKEP